MLPFAGYNMAYYFQHWLDLGAKLQGSGAKLPRIFCVNWFRKGPDGKFVWPGYGENMRVLHWILGRVDGRAGGQEHLFGVSPRFDDLRWDGMTFTREQYERVISIEREAWQHELALHQELFTQLAHGLPRQLEATRQRLQAALAA
jgi:phosphoenolpyruvate carboxykinase (GTP)